MNPEQPAAYEKPAKPASGHAGAQIATFTTDSNSARELMAHQQTMEKIKAGVLGNFVGTGANAATNICGGLLLCLVPIGFFFTYYPADHTNPFEFWKTIFLPLFTLVAGYLFGRKNGNE